MLIKVIEYDIKETPESNGGSYFEVKLITKTKEALYKSHFHYYVINDNWKKITKLKTAKSYLEGYIDFSLTSTRKKLSSILSIEDYNELTIYSSDRESTIKKYIKNHEEEIESIRLEMIKKETNKFSIILKKSLIINKPKKIQIFKEIKEEFFTKEIKRSKTRNDSFLKAIEEFIKTESVNKTLKIIKERTNDKNFISF